MSKQADALRERKIFNDGEVSKLGDEIFIQYCRNGGRSVLPPWWIVHHATKHFKDVPWYTDGGKTFACNLKNDVAPFMDALAFASKLVNCYAWVKTPFGGYVSKNTANKVGIKYKKVITVEQKEK